MNLKLRVSQMTREAFFAWAEQQEARYEFDGFQPVPIGNVTVNHSLIANNIYRALHARLRGTGCSALGPKVGISTIGDTVRNPDALVTCSELTGSDYLVPGAIIVFEVLSTNSDRLDRIIKVREYGAVPNIRRYIIVESTSIGMTLLWRTEADHAFTAKIFTEADHLELPEVGISIPVAECYEGVEFLDGP